MRKTNAQLKWWFPSAVVNNSSDPATHYFEPDQVEISTGAKWMGDHGIAMELCKVYFTWDMTFGESATHQDVMPGGWWKDGLAPVIPGTVDETGFVIYNAWLMSGGTKVRRNQEDEVQGQMLAESYLSNEGLLQGGQKNLRVFTEQYLNLEWDLTDGAGNGTIICVPTLTLDGACRYGQSNINRDTYDDKIMKVPIGQIVVNQMPKTTVSLIYKYRRLNVQEWMSYAQSQATIETVK